MDWAVDVVTNYGYIAIFGLLALGIVGFPVPDEIVMIAAGYMCFLKAINIVVAFLVGFAGSLTGMIISYFIGLRLGQPLIEKFGKWIGLTPKRFNRVKGWYARFGMWTVMIGYFIPGIRHVTSYAAGINAMPFRKYIVIAVVSAITWTALFITIGYYTGHVHHHLA
jgi:membrane protein DedA with SNARE-associated domain